MDASALTTVLEAAIANPDRTALSLAVLFGFANIGYNYWRKLRRDGNEDAWLSDIVERNKQLWAECNAKDEEIKKLLRELAQERRRNGHDPNSGRQ